MKPGARVHLGLALECRGPSIRPIPLCFPWLAWGPGERGPHHLASLGTPVREQPSQESPVRVFRPNLQPFCGSPSVFMLPTPCTMLRVACRESSPQTSCRLSRMIPAHMLRECAHACLGQAELPVLSAGDLGSAAAPSRAPLGLLAPGAAPRPRSSVPGGTWIRVPPCESRAHVGLSCMRWVSGEHQSDS